ncbi:MAG: DJ-1/PfpI family protein [Lachnospiraceae bacterium]|nr:DJ-1/PfpI family protein [Lachnospiraceae bacterium]MBR4994376.1 DJ-1/PfpI family protein [Lachnospiraceae bacterium]
MAKVAAFLAEGFEEVEAITVIDILRRANIEVTTISTMESDKVLGGHGIEVKADALFGDVKYEEYDMLFLPGGGLGFKNLKAHKGLAALLLKFNGEEKFITAICGAPTVLGGLGILKGKKATVYPGLESELEGAICSTDSVVRDGHIITSRGVGTAIDLGLKLVEIFAGAEASKALGKSIVYL